jgi:hypothetical protein
MSLIFSPLFAQENEVIPQFVVGGGYLDARKHSCPLFQAEYKSGSYIWKNFRPQVAFLLATSGSGYIGLGIGWEFYLTKQILIIPSFSPGLYWKGKGRDLGYPIEFRSALEVSYELKNKVRIGVEISHLSNAHLSHRNPGFNALTVCLTFPLELN